MNFKIIFHLDGSGVYFDPNEPMHLDALLAYCLAPHHKSVGATLTRGDVPDHIPLPLMQATIRGHKIWHASALFPVGDVGEDLQFWRKRFRQNRAELSTGAPVLENGTYRDWNTPMPLMLCPKMIAYASGNRKRTLAALKRNVRYIGKKRAYGMGRVASIEAEEVESDWSLVKDGQSMRWLPDESGTRLVRPAPPYWNRHQRIKCCEVGSPYCL